MNIIEFHGKSYPSLSAACRAQLCNRGSVVRAIRQGLSPQEALEKYGRIGNAEAIKAKIWNTELLLAALKEQLALVERGRYLRGRQQGGVGP